MSQPRTQRHTHRYTECFSGGLPSALARALEWSGVEAYQGKEYLRSDEVGRGSSPSGAAEIGKAVRP